MNALKVSLFILLIPLSAFLAPHVLNWEHMLLYGSGYDFSAFGFGAILPMLGGGILAPLFTAIVYFVTSRFMTSQRDVLSLLSAWVVTMIIIMNPLVFSMLMPVFVSVFDFLVR